MRVIGADTVVGRGEVEEKDAGDSSSSLLLPLASSVSIALAFLLVIKLPSLRVRRGIDILRKMFRGIVVVLVEAGAELEVGAVCELDKVNTNVEQKTTLRPKQSS